MHFLKKLQNKIKKVSKFDSYRTLISLKGIIENTSDRIHFLMTSCINEQAECWSKTECTSVALHIPNSFMLQEQVNKEGYMCNTETLFLFVHWI